MRSGPNCYQIGSKRCYIPKWETILEKKDIYITGLKVSSYACKCVFWRPEHNAKEELHGNEFECFEMQKWNILTERAQREDENGILCLVIMFTPGVIVIKMSKMALFSILCWWQQKISHSLEKIFKYIWEILFSSFRKWTTYFSYFKNIQFACFMLQYMIVPNTFKGSKKEFFLKRAKQYL